jgi:hypothetical protein
MQELVLDIHKANKHTNTLQTAFQAATNSTAPPQPQSTCSQARNQNLFSESSLHLAKCASSQGASLSGEPISAAASSSSHAMFNEAMPAARRAHTHLSSRGQSLYPAYMPASLSTHTLPASGPQSLAAGGQTYSGAHTSSALGAYTFSGQDTYTWSEQGGQMLPPQAHLLTMPHGAPLPGKAHSVGAAACGRSVASYPLLESAVRPLVQSELPGAQDWTMSAASLAVPMSTGSRPAGASGGLQSEPRLLQEAWASAAAGRPLALSALTGTQSLHHLPARCPPQSVAQTGVPSKTESMVQSALVAAQAQTGGQSSSSASPIRYPSTLTLSEPLTQGPILLPRPLAPWAHGPPSAQGTSGPQSHGARDSSRQHQAQH